MKKSLFVMHVLAMGGSGTSLLNLLSLYQDRGETCDLFLMAHEGPLLERAGQVANLLPEDKILSSVFASRESLKGRGIVAFFIRSCFVVAHRLFGAEKAMNWVMKRGAKKLSGKYDTIISYQESLPTEFAQYIDAPRRVAWCHMDYNAFSGGKSVERQKALYAKFDHIACVSNVIKESLVEHLGYPGDDISVVYNTIPPKFIKAQAEAESVEVAPGKFIFVSMGRFVDRKRFDRAVLASEALKARGVDFAWYLLGNGPLFEDVKAMVEEKELSDCVILTGPKTNPFVYLKHADCYAMMSENEGQPMVLNEAMTLGIPTLTTDFPSAREVVHHGVDGLIVPNTDEGFVEGVLRFVDDDTMRKTIKEGAQSFVYDNESILRQVSQIIQKKERI